MGLVLVFDMDQTIIDSSNGIKEYKTSAEMVKEIRAAFNEKLVNQVLRPAAKLRDEGKVDAILLLTNSSLKLFASTVSLILGDQLGSFSKYDTPLVNPALKTYYIGANSQRPLESFFDYIMWRGHPARPNSEDPPKSMADVKYMVEQLALPLEDLEERTYFFDDRDDHKIGDEFRALGLDDHYIHIDANLPELASGYSKGAPNSTDYSTMTMVFNKLMKSKGGSRKNKKNKVRKSKYKKTRKH